MTAPLDRVMQMSWFRSVTDTRPEIRELSLRQLDSHVREVRSCEGKGVKEARKYLPLFKAGVFIGGREFKDLDCIECIEGDFDEGDRELDWIVAKLMDHGLAAYIYSTSRHKIESPRFRILCPLSRPRKAVEWKGHFEFLNEVLEGSLDPNAAKASQVYFIGALECGADPDPFHLDGPRLEYIDTALELRGISGADTVGVTVTCPEDDEDPFDAIELYPSRDPDRIRTMLEHISPDEHDVWIKVGLALFHLLGQEGFPIWDNWSAGSAKYGETEKRWKSFSKPRGRKKVGLKSLMGMAADGGWKDTLFDPDIDRLNRKHALVRVKGKTLVATFEKDGSTSLGQLKDLHAFYENDRTERSGGGTEPVSRKWWRHPERRTYPDGLIFAPGRETPSKLNLWTGWKVRPDPHGSCELFLEHVRSVVCAGDPIGFQYVIGWLAHLVQRPWEIPGVAIVLKGEKGTGKDTFVDYLVPLIGEQHVPTVSHQEHVTGRFNARLETALLLHLQEGIWGGDRKAEQSLKYLITSGRIEIERKGVDSYGSCSSLRIIITGNADWIVPASADERRFAVFTVSNSRKGAAEYFEAIRLELTNGGPEALLSYLQSYDLSEFDVRKAPPTTGLLEQKLESLRGVNRWWHECLVSGDIVPSASLVADSLDAADWGSASVSVAKAELRDSYSAWLRSRRYAGDPVNEAMFSKSIRNLAPSIEDKRPRVKSERRRDFVLPPLQRCREEFERWLGHRIPWAD